MEVNLCLAFRPLTCATCQKNDFGFDRFNVEHSIVRGIDLSPHVKRCLAVSIPPCIAVIPSFTNGVESQFEVAPASPVW